MGALPARRAPSGQEIPCALPEEITPLPPWSPRRGGMRAARVSRRNKRRPGTGMAALSPERVAPSNRIAESFQRPRLHYVGGRAGLHHHFLARKRVAPHLRCPRRTPADNEICQAGHGRFSVFAQVFLNDGGKGRQDPVDVCFCRARSVGDPADRFGLRGARARPPARGTSATWRAWRAAGFPRFRRHRCTELLGVHGFISSRKKVAGGRSTVTPPGSGEREKRRTTGCPRPKASLFSRSPARGGSCRQALRPRGPDSPR